MDAASKSEFIYHTQASDEYTIYWNHFDEISNKSIFQTINPEARIHRHE